MNRSFRDSMIGGGKSFPVAPQLRRGLSVNGASNKDLSDDSLDLFSRTRRSVSVVNSDESDVSVKPGRLSVGSVKVGRNGLDDLLSSTEGGKHDYDWLLTPPETPLVPSLIGNEPQRVQVAQRSSSLARSVSTTKASRLSVSHSESNHNARPARSSSVTRSSVSSTQFSTYSNKSTNILNTSSASVSSYIRSSTPSSRSSSSARNSTPTSRPTLSRPSTPSKACPAPNTTSRPSQNSRPSTPSSRPQIPANLTSPSPRSTSRASTPTRRNTAPSICQSPVISASSRRPVTSGRTVASISRPSSPDPPVRRTPQPIVPPDFSLETPSNLRTTLPNRPLSAGRSRPGAAVSVKANMDTPIAGTLPRRQPSPVSRGRLTESSASGRGLSNGHVADTLDSRRASFPLELTTRKSIKTPTENMGFGRNISKKSLDMAIKHMDIRNGSNGARPLSGSIRYPHSIRSNGAKSHSHSASSPASLNGNMNFSNNGPTSENGSYISRSSENGSEDDRSRFSARLTDTDIYESCRYDMILLKEDVKNTNWLHSIDDKLDGTIFENGFEPLPEPFDHL
nr:mucin-5AC-like [Ipomoea trifida]